MKRQNPETRLLKPILQFALQKYPVPRFRDAFLCSHFDALLMLSVNFILTYIITDVILMLKNSKAVFLLTLSLCAFNYSRNMIVDIIIKVVLGY